MPQPAATGEPQLVVSWGNAIVQALELEGVESRSLFEVAGVPYQATTDPTMRIETRKITHLFKLAVEATSNPAFGLKASQRAHPGTFHALGYSLFASGSLQEFCQRLIRFFRLLSDNANHSVVEEKDAFKLCVERTNDYLSHESVDGWLGVVASFCRSIYRPDFTPMRVTLQRPRPASHAEDFEQFFGCPVSFDAEETAIYFSKSDFLAPLPGGSPELARRSDEVVIEHLARLDKDDITRQVEALLVELLPTGDCSKEKIAEKLHMSQRTLHNKLVEAGRSYHGIRDDLRITLARGYLEQADMSISAITYLLGFSDTSNFARFFKRHYGTSPTAYREGLS